MTVTLISASFGLPLLVAAAIAFAGMLPSKAARRVRRIVSFFAPISTLPGLALALWGDSGVLGVPWLLMGSHIGVDNLGRPLLLVASILYTASLVMISWLKLRYSERRYSGLVAFMLVTYVGAIGTFLAADTWTFYLAFALMSFSAAGLIIHVRTRKARRATGIYLTMTVLSESSLLAAVLLTANAGGLMLADVPAAIIASDHTGLIMSLLLIGFGVKAGTVPLHVWLPLAHPVAPPTASAVLSGILVKAGVMGWLRFFPVGEASAASFGHSTVATIGWVLLVLSLLGALFAALLGVVQSDPKVVLAYSTISQLGMIGALVAVGLINPALAPDAAVAAVLYVAHHSLAKGALFLSVPVADHYGHGRTGVLVRIGIAGAGLALAGAPLTSGAFGKYVAKESVAGIDVVGAPVSDLLPFVATGSTLLLMRFAHIMWKRERTPHRAIDGELPSWLLLCAAGAIVPWLIGAFWSPLALPEWTAQSIWDASWPILLGFAVGLAVWWLAVTERLPQRFTRVDDNIVPPGDVIVNFEAVYERLVRLGGRAMRRGDRGAQRVRTMVGSLPRAVPLSKLDAAERAISPWRNSGVAILAVLTIILAIAVIVGLFQGGAL